MQDDAKTQGDSSAATVETLPIVEDTPTEPISMTQAELDKRINDGKAEIGRRLKDMETSSNTTKAQNELLLQQIQERDGQLQQAAQQHWDREYERVKDDPSALRNFQQTQEMWARDQELRQNQAKFEQDKKQWETDVVDAKKFRQMQEAMVTAQEVSTRLGVPAEVLMLSDGSKESMEKLATFVKSLATPSSEAETETGEKPKPPGKPDSLRGSGGGLSDAAFIEKVGSGDIPLDKDNMARAKRLGLA